MYKYRQPPSGQSRAHQVAQLRTDGVFPRDSAVTMPAFLKVVRVTGAAFSDVIIFFPHAHSTNLDTGCAIPPTVSEARSTVGVVHSLARAISSVADDGTLVTRII